MGGFTGFRDNYEQAFRAPPERMQQMQPAQSQQAMHQQFNQGFPEYMFAQPEPYSGPFGYSQMPGMMYPQTGMMNLSAKPFVPSASVTESQREPDSKLMSPQQPDRKEYSLFSSSDHEGYESNDGHLDLSHPNM